MVITVVLLIGGFVYPWFFLAVAFVRWPILVGLRNLEETEPNWSPGQTLAAINEGVSKLNSYVETAAAVQRATAPSRAIFRKEQIAIESSIESTLQSINADAFLLSKNEEYRQCYDKVYI